MNKGAEPFFSGCDLHIKCPPDNNALSPYSLPSPYLHTATNLTLSLWQPVIKC